MKTVNGTEPKEFIVESIKGSFAKWQIMYKNERGHLLCLIGNHGLAVEDYQRHDTRACHVGTYYYTPHNRRDYRYSDNGAMLAALVLQDFPAASVIVLDGSGYDGRTYKAENFRD